ncbi:MAG: aminotransferase class III-fold pyridoxal phosphate-dependent enzyme, partial [Gemmatimonadota bacterium]|nr:aminotransferase class III-fold pyridoxal phosphate-dependent enzyme [Gemmatimonadota bacterium]
MTGRASGTNGALHERARDLFPGGVSSPVRAWGSVGGTPRFLVDAEGAHVVDVEGARYLDYVSSWGAIILGHADPEVVGAVCEAAGRGTSYGAPIPGAIVLAARIRSAMPWGVRMRFVS